MHIVTMLLLSVVLSPPFGAAEATAVSTTGGLTFEVSVEVNAPATAVLVRPVGLGTELPPVALADLGDGRWVGVVELTTVENIQVAFELIPTIGPSTVSEVHTLTELGVDRAVFERSASTTGTDADDDAEENRQWVWLALAAGAAGLALLVIWAWGGRDDEDDDGEAEAADAADALETASDDSG